MSSDDDKIGIKEVHESLWKCRDFELVNLWQRSIFLTAFLVLVFTAYGAAVSKLIDKLAMTNSILIILNFTCYALCILGIVFSIMWIKMGKGSKAWYEAYEKAIEAFGENNDFYKTVVQGIGGFSYNRQPRYKGFNVDNSIFSGKAGEFSVSKINIGIGRVFLILWFLVGLCHTIVFGFIINYMCPDQAYLIISVLAFGVFTLIAVAYYLGREETFASGAIGWFKEKYSA